MDTVTPSAPATTEATAAPSLAAVSAAEDWFRPCVLFIVDAESPKLSDTVHALIADDLPCLLIDGSGAPDVAARLCELARNPGVHLFHHTAISDRGGAILRGLHEAARLGYSHAAQVDANGRDDLQRVSLFLDRASQAPDAVICSHPQPDPTATSADFAVWCITRVSRLSVSARALLCELRVYPLATTLAHAACPQLTGARHYDSELLLRMHGRNQPMVWLRTASLPGADGRSCGRMGALGMARFLARAILPRG